MDLVDPAVRDAVLSERLASELSRRRDRLIVSMGGRTLVLAGLAVALVACDSNCDSVGCSTGADVLFDASAVAVPSYPITVRICVDDVCEYRDFAAPPAGRAVLWPAGGPADETSPRSVTVNAVLTDETDAVLADARITTQLQKTYESECLTCYYTQLVFNAGTGKLDVLSHP
jgi:hypothetical protein